MENKKQNYFFIVKGRKWWDKINGNTYNSAKVFIIIDNVCEKVERVRFEYGYGSDYYFRAVDKIKEFCEQNKIVFNSNNIFDAGADYDKKTNTKNFLY